MSIHFHYFHRMNDFSLLDTFSDDFSTFVTLATFLSPTHSHLFHALSRTQMEYSEYISFRECDMCEVSRIF